MKQEPDSRRAATADAREGIPLVHEGEDVNEPITYVAYVARAHQRARRAHLLAQIAFRDDLELSLTGGCPSCGLEADDMCVACQLCNCDSHETCVRPAEPEEGAR